MYGFPLGYLGYLGPQSVSRGTPNHPSALNFQSHIDKFIQNEVALGGVVGPMAEAPFHQWTYISPLMSRAKKGSSSCRVISDMTFPSSVSAFLMKNAVNGVRREHILTTVEGCITELLAMGQV